MGTANTLILYPLIRQYKYCFHWKMHARTHAHTKRI